MKINKPTNQRAEVLYLLIKHDCINRRDVLLDTGILNVTARIANLRNSHQIAIDCKRIETKNKFGRKISYGQWSISKRICALTNVLKIYNKINK